jgi:hypothetical protein
MILLFQLMIEYRIDYDVERAMIPQREEEA